MTGETLMNGVRAFIKGSREIFCPFCHVRVHQEVYDLEEGPDPVTLLP